MAIVVYRPRPIPGVNIYVKMMVSMSLKDTFSPTANPPKKAGMIVEEIKTLRAEGWPPVATITDPELLTPGRFRVELLDARGRTVGDPIELEADSHKMAAAFVEAARAQLKR